MVLPKSAVVVVRSLVPSSRGRRTGACAARIPLAQRHACARLLCARLLCARLLCARLLCGGVTFLAALMTSGLAAAGVGASRPSGSGFVPIAEAFALIVAIGFSLFTAWRKKDAEKTAHDLEGNLAALRRDYARLIEDKNAADILAERCPAAFLSVAPENGAVLCNNAAAERLTGYASDTLRTMNVLDLYADTPDGMSKARRAFRRFAKGRNVSQEQVQIRRKDGTVRWVFLTIYPLDTATDDGTPCGTILTDISPVKGAEEEVRLRAKRFYTLTETAPVGIFRADAAGALVYANAACRDFMDPPRSSIIGLGWPTFLHPLHPEETAPLWRETLESGAPFSAQFSILDKDRHEIWIFVRIVVEKDVHGELVGTIGSITDITATKYAQTLIQQTEKRFHLALENIPDVIVLYAPDLTIRYINAATRNITGRPESDFIGKRDEDIFPPEVYETYLPALVRARDTGEAQSVTTTLKLTDEGPHHLEIKCIPVSGKNGKVQEIIGITHDITDITQAQNDLAVSEERFALALRATNDSLWDWDLLNGEAYYSARWKAMLGCKNGEFPDTPDAWEKRAHPDDLARVKGQIEAAIRNAPTSFEIEFRLRHEDGSWLDTLLRGAVIANTKGLPIRLIGTYTDISTRKGTERQIARLEGIRKTISQCTSALIHISDENRLLHEMCEILVENRGYDLAWIGYANRNSEKTVTPMAGAGRAHAYVENIDVRWDDGPLGNGPTGRAIRTGAVQKAPDLKHASDYAPWIEEAEKWGLKASIALPLMGNTRAFGALNIYSCRADQFDEQEIDLLCEFSADLAYGLRMLQAQKDRDRSQKDLSKSLLETIYAIALTVEKRDPYTAGHQRRVAELSARIAQTLGWDEERIEGLRLGAIIHDLGKIYIPAEILNRSGKLSKYEFGMIKSHPEIGADIIAGVQFPWPIKKMILQHHERLDGTGYPKGLKNGAIIEEARIIAVADVVEAIASHRPYRGALGIDAGLEEINRGRGTAYDPDVVDACLKVVKDDGFLWE